MGDNDVAKEQKKSVIQLAKIKIKPTIEKKTKKKGKQVVSATTDQSKQQTNPPPPADEHTQTNTKNDKNQDATEAREREQIDHERQSNLEEDEIQEEVSDSEGESSDEDEGLNQESAMDIEAKNDHTIQLRKVCFEDIKHSLARSKVNNKTLKALLKRTTVLQEKSERFQTQVKMNQISPWRSISVVNTRPTRNQAK